MSRKAVQDEMLACLPNVRAFAISLCGNVDRADDLVQEAVMKAWRHLDTYTEGTNMRAWMFTILRNVFISEFRTRRLVTTSIDAEPSYAAWLTVRPEQHGWMDGQDLQRALAQLTRGQREAIILVGAEGVTYEDAAAICGCPVGTIKSRVNRARVRLAELLDIDLGDEAITKPDEARAPVPLPLPPAAGRAVPAARSGDRARAKAAA